MTGKLYGIGVGPGDPELMTRKAERLIEEADVVALPDGRTGRSVVVEIVGDLVKDKELAWCPSPMTRDETELAAAHTRAADDLCALLDEGKTVAYLCLGDVTLYSSFMYVYNLVTARGYEVELVPGVTSVSAAAARLGVALCQGDERLLIAPASDDSLDEVLGFPANKVLVKPGRHDRQMREALSQHGLLDTAMAVSACGMPDERVIRSLADADDGLGYLTILFIRDERPGTAPSAY